MLRDAHAKKIYYTSYKFSSFFIHFLFQKGGGTNFLVLYSKNIPKIYMNGNFFSKTRVFNKKEIYAINLKSERLMSLLASSKIKH